MSSLMHNSITYVKMSQIKVATQKIGGYAFFAAGAAAGASTMPKASLR